MTVGVLAFVLAALLGCVLVEWRYWRGIAKAQAVYITQVDALLKESIQQTNDALATLRRVQRPGAGR